MTGSGMRYLWTGAAVAAGLAALAPATAEAGKKRTQHDVELARPAASPDADAAGVLRVTTTARGETGVLRLSDLDPRTRYAVHDADTDEVLGKVRTNRKGKATLKLRRKVRSAGKKAVFDLPERIEICPIDGDGVVLVGGTDAPPREDLPAFGFAYYEGRDGWSAFVDVFSFPPQDMESFRLSLNGLPTERGAPGEEYEYARDTLAGDELPLGVASVAELAGRAFRVVGPDGTVYVRGVLPALERPELRLPPETDFPVVPLPDVRFTDRPVRDGTATRTAAGKMDWSRGWDGTWTDPGFDVPGFLGPPDFELPPDGDGLPVDWIDILPPDWLPFPMPEREPSRLRLEIADDDGTLTDCGHLDHIVWPEIDWPVWPCPMDGEERPVDETGTATR